MGWHTNHARATRDPPMRSQAAAPALVTLDPSTSRPLPTPTRSCGRQPTPITLTARRTGPCHPTGLHHCIHTTQRAARSPVHLTDKPSISGVLDRAALRSPPVDGVRILG